MSGRSAARTQGALTNTGNNHSVPLEPPSSPIAPMAGSTSSDQLRPSRWREGIWVVYLIEDRGLTLGQVILLDAVVFGVTVIAEVPTGMIADRYTRRVSMLLGSLLTAAAFVTFGLASSVTLLAGSYVLFAIGGALMSGADEAFLFDVLRADGRSGEFAGVVGRLNARMTVGVALCTVAGGLMVIWTPLSWPLIASGGLSLAGAGFAWALTEPPCNA